MHNQIKSIVYEHYNENEYNYQFKLKCFFKVKIYAIPQGKIKYRSLTQAYDYWQDQPGWYVVTTNPQRE